MAANTQTDDSTEMPDGYNHEPIRDAELEGLTTTRAANIAGELELTTVESIEHIGGEEYHVRLEVDGGFLAFVNGSTKFGITHVGGRGDPDTVTVTVVEKRV